jgi:hypothetical protein
MKIHYCSDLHLDFGADLTLPGGEVLILAGDIAEANIFTEPEIQNFWTAECSKYDKVFYVLGNHEHYHSTFNKTLDKIRPSLPSNVCVMENDRITYQGIDFVGCTLWTDLNKSDPNTMMTIPYLLNDYRVIKHEYKGCYNRLSPYITVKTHEQSVDFITKSLTESENPVIVITHHAPSLASIHERYRTVKDFNMNGAFASDLSNLILDHTDKIHTWIHGHMHDRINYQVGKTTIRCNPRGYIKYEPQAKTFEVQEFEI